jgi:Aconitase A
MNIKVEFFQHSGNSYKYYPLRYFEEQGYKLSKYPYSIKILIENVARNYDGKKITEDDLKSILNWEIGNEFAFMPTRVLMQDYTGVPLIVDLAAMRSEFKRKGLDPELINPIIPSDLIIDHSIQVDYFGTNYAFYLNLKTEYERNKERYQLLKWAKNSFKNLRIVPPGNGIIHQVNLEYLSKVINVREHDGHPTAFPEIIIGTDSHTTMANGLRFFLGG